MKGIELVARGVLARSGQVLLVHKKGAANTFLPGGHIEFGEPAKAALKREIKEELGIAVAIGNFLGVVEHSWEDENGLNHEINLIFAMECDELSVGEVPTSQESHLEFLWQPVEDMAFCDLEPSPLIGLLPEWFSKQPDVGWGSTIE